MENYIQSFDEFIGESKTGVNQKMSLHKYKKEVEKILRDNEMFQDQLFYDHMIDCFVSGITPKECVENFY